jgi:hypothetical protein
MQQRSLKRLLFVALLAGGLAFAGPAQAYAAPVDGPQGWWKWLTQFWGEEVSVFWGHPGPSRPSSEKPGWQKQGGCVDPNGCVHAATPAAGPTCHLWNEQGGCIDPNG